MRRLLTILCFLIIALPAFSAGAEPADEEALWAMLREGRAVAMIRHARAPGIGDPAGFRLEDCATQRNLSEDGRAQAGAIGAAFRAHGVAVTQVLSSRWCRCLDTARIAFGQVTPFPPLDSFFDNPETETVQTESLKDHLHFGVGAGTVVLVTHQVNITALTGIFPREGEVILLTSDALGRVQVKGRMFPAEIPR